MTPCRRFLINLAKRLSPNFVGNASRPGGSNTHGMVQYGTLTMVFTRPDLLVIDVNPKWLCVESDYTIFVWRQKSTTPESDSWPVLHVRNPDEPLPSPPEYQNMSFYMFQPKSAPSSPVLASGNAKSSTPKKKKTADPRDATPQFKKDFERFHSENGVRTIKGTIGPVKDGKFSIIQQALLHWHCCQSACYSKAAIVMLQYRVNLLFNMASFLQIQLQDAMDMLALSSASL